MWFCVVLTRSILCKSDLCGSVGFVLSGSHRHGSVLYASDLCGSAGFVLFGSEWICSGWFCRVCFISDLCASVVFVFYGSDLWGLFWMCLFCVFSSAPWRVPFRTSRVRLSPSRFHLLPGGSSITMSRNQNPSAAVFFFFSFFG